MRRRRADPTRLGRLETLGAWLRIWTPPKGAHVPPVPKRKLAFAALAAAAVLGLAAALAVPRIEHGKERGAARERARSLAVERAEARRLRADQAPHRGSSPRLRGARLDAGARRDALVRDLEAAITRDARARARRGVLDGPIAHTRCERAEIAGEERFARVFGRYQCLAVSSTNRSVRGHPFETGYPFVATIHYRQLRYVWCKLNPRPGEKAAGKATAVVPVPRVCAGPLASIY